MTAGVMFNTYYFQEQEGLAAFRVASNDPEDLEDLWPSMGEPELQTQHEARIAPVDAASNRSLYWAFGGLLGVSGARHPRFTQLLTVLTTPEQLDRVSRALAPLLAAVEGVALNGAAE